MLDTIVHTAAIYLASRGNFNNDQRDEVLSAVLEAYAGLTEVLIKPEHWTRVTAKNRVLKYRAAQKGLSEGAHAESWSRKEIGDTESLKLATRRQALEETGATTLEEVESWGNVTSLAAFARRHSDKTSREAACMAILRGYWPLNMGHDSPTPAHIIKRTSLIIIRNRTLSTLP